jgi:hypothetical protein
MVRLFLTGISQLFSVKSSTYQRKDKPSGGKNNRFLAFSDTPQTTTSGPLSKNSTKPRKTLRRVLLMIRSSKVCIEKLLVIG